MSTAVAASLTSTKRTLLALSHAMESSLGDETVGPGGRLVLGLFQRKVYFEAEALRYAALAARGVTCVVAFAGGTDGVPHGVHAVDLDPADPLAEEWSLVVLDDTVGSALVALDTGRLAEEAPSLEAARVFDGRWTLDRHLAAAEAARLLDLLEPSLPSAVAADARRVVDRALEAQPDPAVSRLTRVTEGLVSRIDRVQRTSARLSAELDETRRLAELDQLTGLHNRHFLQRWLESGGDEVAPATAALLVDLDRLKSINDTYGHAAGDAAIQVAADCIRASTRSTDVVSRVGGDEFLVLIPGGDAEAGLAAGERIVTALAGRRMPEPWGDLRLSASVGVTVTDAVRIPLDRLDQALYEVKRNGRGQVRFAPA